MIKNLNLKSTVLITFMLTLFALACKKEVTTENANQIDNAKEWYVNLTAKSKTAFKASNDATESIATQFDWNNAKTYNFSDGKEVIATPVNMVKPNNKTVPGSFMLLVYKDNNEYHSQMIYNQKDNYFGETVSKSDVEASFIIAQKNKELRSLAKSKVAFSNNANGKVMVAQETPPVCTDWYLVIFTYDDWGNVTEIIDELYLNTTCTDGTTNGGGGGNGTSPELPIIPTIEWGDPVSVEGMIFTETTDIVGIDTFKVKPLSWIFHQGITFQFISTERGAVKIKNGIRTQWDSLTHISSTDQGFWALGSVNLYGPLKATPTVQNNSSFMELEYRLQYSPGVAVNVGSNFPVGVTITPPPIKSSTFYSAATWDKNFMKIS